MKKLLTSFLLTAVASSAFAFPDITKYPHSKTFSFGRTFATIKNNYIIMNETEKNVFIGSCCLTNYTIAIDNNTRKACLLNEFNQLEQSIDDLNHELFDMYYFESGRISLVKFSKFRVLVWQSYID